jgi:hypothetical protein
VDDPCRVGMGERLANFEHVVHCLGRRKWPSLRQSMREINPKQAIHHDVWLTGRQRIDVDHAHDVLARDARRRTSLTQEPGDHVRPIQHSLVEQLDGDLGP